MQSVPGVVGGTRIVVFCALLNGECDMTTWDDRVRAVFRAERQQREADGKLFGEIWSYLRDCRDEEIEIMHMETLPDGRDKGRKMWRDQCVFSFRVASGKVIVREGDLEAHAEESFDDREAAYQRMAVHMWRAKMKAA